ncbi:hypothetical protein GCM10023169_26900 [Georgenia halophila]|uniref:Integral membrane protein n=1 Tax=Georgenia halophila TaxID=620889 RepID=A0ABP8LES9_9MICO
MVTELLSTVRGAAYAGIDNPIGGESPNFDVLGVAFDNWFTRIFGALWAIAILVAIVMLLWGIVTMAMANDNPHDYASGRGRVLKSLIALVVLAAFGVIVGAILNVAGG